jgi:hypothetical protein
LRRQLCAVGEKIRKRQNRFKTLEAEKFRGPNSKKCEHRCLIPLD